MTTRASRALAGLAAGTLVLSGCGALSASDLRSQAADICNAQKHATSRLATPTTPAQVQVFVTRGLAIIRPEVSQLHSLEPPAALRAPYRQTLSAIDRELALISATQAQVRTGTDPIDAFTSLHRQLAPLAAQEDAGWRALRIPQCTDR